MDIDGFLSLVKRRRSIRRFKPDPIPDEYVTKILEAARWAMSGANGQPWEFIVVKDEATKKKIGEIYVDYWKKVYTLEKMRIEDFRHPMFTGPPAGTPGFVDAPVLIVVCGDPRTYLATVLIAHFYAGEGGPDATYLKNMANATMIIHLAAAALGLGSQWLSFDRSWERPIKELLDVPDELEIHTIVPIGYPAYKPPGPYRRQLKEIVHYEKYDRSRLRTEDDILEYIGKLRAMTREAYKKGIPWKV
jgi:nitroreductase